MTKPLIGYGRQSVDDDDIAAVVSVLRSDYLTQGPVVERFEQALAARVGARHAIAVANGTAALHLACLAAGLGPGDAAVVPDMTFVATANAPVYCGARAELADIEPEGRGLAVAPAVTRIRSDRTVKAVLPVHFAGLAVGMADLAAVKDEAVIIEDACHALGGTYEDGSPVGCCRHSHMTAFSFHPVKPITTAEGGAVTTNDDEMARRLRILRNHGIERDPARFVHDATDGARPWYYEQQLLGYNYRMTDLQAALGASQLGRLDAFVDKRRRIAAFYDNAFKDLPGVSIPQSGTEQRARSGLHLYQLDIDFAARGIDRGRLMEDLRQDGIGTQVHYIPVHRQPYHARRTSRAKAEFPNAERHYQRTLTIPLSAAISDAEVEYVADHVRGRLK